VDELDTLESYQLQIQIPAGGIDVVKSAFLKYRTFAERLEPEIQVFAEFHVDEAGFKLNLTGANA
jgi:hypothetical protein